MERLRNEAGGRIQGLAFLVIFGGLFVLVGLLFRPFLSVLLWAGVVYAITAPLYRHLTTAPGGQERSLTVRTLWSVILALGVLVVIVAPLVFLGFVLVGQARELVVAVGTFLRGQDVGGGTGLWAQVVRWINEGTGGLVQLEPQALGEQAMGLLRSLGQEAAGLSTALVRDLAKALFGLVFFVFTLFFLYLDGRHLLRILVEALPIDHRIANLFLRKFRDTGRNVVLGSFLIGLFQGIMGFLVFWAMGVPGPLVLGLLTFITSFIPILGTGLVWWPVVIARAATGDLLGAGITLVLSAVFISSLDNVLRPLILHSRLKLHPLMVFFSIVGGLNLFGFDGLILGPLILVIFFTAVDIFARIYGRKWRPRDQAPGV